MASKISWTETGKRDFKDILDFVSYDSKEVAKNIFKDTNDSLKRLSSFPLQGRIVPELDRQGIRRYREIVITPWRIIYSLEGDYIYIQAMLDGRRNLEDLLLRRNLR